MTREAQIQSSGSDVSRRFSRRTSLFVVNHQIPYAGPRGLRHLFARLYKWYLKKGSGKTISRAPRAL